VGEAAAAVDAVAAVEAVLAVEAVAAVLPAVGAAVPAVAAVEVAESICFRVSAMSWNRPPPEGAAVVAPTRFALAPLPEVLPLAPVTPFRFASWLIQDWLPLMLLIDIIAHSEIVLNHKRYAHRIAC
jgi:hypothetical protein